MDALVWHFTRKTQRFDRGAKLARQGVTNAKVLKELLRDPYLRLGPPKSTGREYYGRAYFQELLRLGKKFGAEPNDLIRTTTEFTVASVVDALRRFVLKKTKVQQLIVSGGGAKNPLIMAQLTAALAPMEVMASSKLGVPEEAKEAYAFALLAYETWNRQGGKFAECDGGGERSGVGEDLFLRGGWKFGVVSLISEHRRGNFTGEAPRRVPAQRFTAEAAEGHRGNGDCLWLGGDGVVAFEDFADLSAGIAPSRPMHQRSPRSSTMVEGKAPTDVTRIENERDAIAELAEDFFATFTGGRAGNIGAGAGERDAEFGDEIVDDFVPGPAESDAASVASDFEGKAIGSVDDDGERTRPAGLRETIEIVGKILGEDLGVDERVDENGKGAVFGASFDAKNFFDGSEIDGIGRESVERVRRNSDDRAPI